MCVKYVPRQGVGIFAVLVFASVVLLACEQKFLGLKMWDLSSFFTGRMQQIGSVVTDKFVLQNINITTNHSNWIIVTTSSPPTPAVEYLSRLTRWKVVVVGVNNAGTSEAWRLINCKFIQVDEQKVSSNHSNQTTSPNLHYIGYLYAIANGAKIIYQVDGQNMLTGAPDHFLDDGHDWHGLTYAGQRVFNPYRHFGQSSIWPRGYPVNNRKDTDKMYTVGANVRPSIIQILSNGDPDVDSKTRLTLKSDLNITFDIAAPPVVVPARVMSPINSKNTIFRYEAFWALVVLVTPPLEHCDILRGYWAQRLLWEIYGQIGFYPPNGYQHRKPQPSVAKHIPPFDTTKYIDFLLTWKCDPNVTFFQCVEVLSKELSDGGFWKVADFLLIKSWLRHLSHVGYTEPKRSAIIDKNTLSKNIFPVIYEPTAQSDTRDSGTILNSKLKKQVSDIRAVCSNTSSVGQNVSSNASPVTIRNVVLLIWFSTPFFDNIPYLKLMYDVAFDRIIFCGPKISAFRQSSVRRSFKVTFIEAENGNGHYGFNCYMGAVMMNFGVKGIISIGDDCLLNPWNMNKLPLDQPWLNLDEMEPMFRNKNHRYYWWSIDQYRIGFNKSWDILQNVAKSSAYHKPTIDKFTQTVKANSGSEFGIYHCPSDIWYIPTIHRRTVITFLDPMVTYRGFLEVVMPTLIYGLGDKKLIVSVTGKYLWYDGKRKIAETFYKPDKVFLHPMKLSGIKSTLKNFFCKKYYPLLVQQGN